MKNNAKSAFTLLELATVIIILGLISVGIVKGVSIVNSSRLAAARSLTTNSKISEIEGLMAWYETSMIDSIEKSEITQSAQISKWHDISPGSIVQDKNLLTATPGANLTYERDGINSLPSLSFAGANLALASFSQGTAQQNTVFIVLRPNVAPSSTQMILLDSHSSGSSAEIGIKNNAVYMNMGSGVSTATGTYPASFAIKGNYIVAAYVNQSQTKVYVNNGVNAAGNGAISPGSNILSGLTIGRNKSSSNAFTGLISEVIIFNRILQIDERKTVMGYLSKKYKIYVYGAN